MTSTPTPADAHLRPYRQIIDGTLAPAIGSHGLAPAAFEKWLTATRPVIDDLRKDHHTGRLPLLTLPAESADIDAAEAAVAKLIDGAGTVVFFGTGGSGLGGQTLAQLSGWGIPGSARRKRPGPRTRFYDNLDPETMEGLLADADLASMRFIVTSKSGGTAETLAQLITTLAAIKSAGLESEIPRLFLGITEPAAAGKANGLRALLASYGVPMLEHHTGIGGRFSCLTNVGLMPAIVRGLDAHRIRAGAKSVVDELLSATAPGDCAPAVGAASAVALAKEQGIRTLVVMPYTDRLGRFADWYVQLWAESLGKGGEGTTPVPAIGPVDQHSQLQLFMDGPREIALTLIRVASRGAGPVIDAGLAERAGASFMGGRTVGDVVDAQAHAVEAALLKAGRPVRTIDFDRLDEFEIGALLMHFMLETIIAGRLLGLDPFDQPAVELAKILTRERLAGS